MPILPMSLAIDLRDSHSIGVFLLRRISFHGLLFPLPETVHGTHAFRSYPLQPVDGVLLMFFLLNALASSGQLFLFQYAYMYG